MASTNITVELLCIIILIIITIHMVVSDTGKSKVNRLYIATLFANMFTLMSDIVCWSFESNPHAYATPIIRVSNFTTYILEYLLGMLYIEYIIAYISTKNKISKKYSYVMYFIYGVATILVIISQFNGMYYFFDADNNFYRGHLNWLSYTLPGICLVICTYIILRYMKNFRLWDILALLSFQILPLIAVLAQLVSINIPMRMNTLFTISLLINYVAIQLELNKRFKQNELELAKAKIAFLQSQIKPHFLFNTLNAIRGLVSIDEKRTKKLIEDLAEFLRGSFDFENHGGLIALENEIATLRAYVSIEQARFENQIDMEYDISNADNVLIPMLIIQPLVENAIRHGLKNKDEIKITLHVISDKEKTIIEVQDNGIGILQEKIEKILNNSEKTSGIGLRNINQRLLLSYGKGLNIESSEKGTKITVVIPKREVINDESSAS